MSELKKKLMAFLLDIIDTETAKPDEEANMALVEECTMFLEELMGDTEVSNETR